MDNLSREAEFWNDWVMEFDKIREEIVSDEEIDEEELEKRIWNDSIKLKKIKEKKAQKKAAKAQTEQDLREKLSLISLQDRQLQEMTMEKTATRDMHHYDNGTFEIDLNRPAQSHYEPPFDDLSFDLGLLESPGDDDFLYFGS